MIKKNQDVDSYKKNSDIRKARSRILIFKRDEHYVSRLLGDLGIKFARIKRILLL